ncbi:MAG: hypothetical protein ABIO84_05150 [Lysobacter sp.]
MSETMLLDIDPVLLERVRRLAASRGWGQQAAITHLLEHGLFACEVEQAAPLDDSDATALQAAIDALERIDNDPGFSLIGRLDDGSDEAVATDMDSGATGRDTPIR